MLRGHFRKSVKHANFAGEIVHGKKRVATCALFSKSVDVVFATYMLNFETHMIEFMQ